MKKENNERRKENSIKQSNEKSIDENKENSVEQNNENSIESFFSDDVEKALRDMPESEWREENIEYSPFPINDGNDLRRSKNQYRRYIWVLKKLPKKEERLIQLMNFAFNKQKKENYPIVKQFLVLNLLIKTENDVLIPTIDFVNYIKDLHSEIERYEKEGKEE